MGTLRAQLRSLALVVENRSVTLNPKIATISETNGVLVKTRETGREVEKFSLPRALLRGRNCLNVVSICPHQLRADEVVPTESFATNHKDISHTQSFAVPFELMVPVNKRGIHHSVQSPCADTLAVCCVHPVPSCVVICLVAPLLVPIRLHQSHRHATVRFAGNRRETKERSL